MITHVCELWDDTRDVRGAAVCVCANRSLYLFHLENFS